jgi:segregation and condensation protein B
MEEDKKDKIIEWYQSEEWLKACVEGILFVSECTVKASDISSVLGITEKKVCRIIELLEKEYVDGKRGFIVRRTAGGFRLYSNPLLNEILAKFVKSNIHLYISRAALETLAIISYRQPVTRTQIAEIRGVRADSVILTLMDKGLIKEAGRLKEPGSPMTYKVSEKFLEILGINSLEELPPLKDFDESNESNESNENNNESNHN